MAKKGGWTAFPHDNGAFVYDGAALKKNWARLHKGDAEPFPTDKAVEEAWRLYHAGDFQGAYEAGLAAGLKVLGQFGCRGKVDPKVIDALLKKPEHKAWAEESRGADGNPDAADLKDAAEFAQAMVVKAY